MIFLPKSADLIIMAQMYISEFVDNEPQFHNGTVCKFQEIAPYEAVLLTAN
jgi:hypothetical protein